MRRSDAIITAGIGLVNGVVFYLVGGEIILKELGIKIPYLWLLPIVFPPLGVMVMYIVSLVAKRFFAILQLARFFLVGTLNTFVDFGVLNLLMAITGIFAGPFYVVFKGISFLTATINSYLWNKHWTFEKRKEVFAPGEYFKFLVVVTIGLLIHVSVSHLVVNVIGPQFGLSLKIWANVGAFIAVLTAWLWNFTGAKFLVFKK